MSAIVNVVAPESSGDEKSCLEPAQVRNLPPRFSNGRFAKACNLSRTVEARKRRREIREQAEGAECGGCGDQENDEPRAKHRQVSSPENLDIGRHTVHLRCLAEGLAECRNPDCKQPLVLADATGEKRYGLGSVLAIPRSLQGMQICQPGGYGHTHRDKRLAWAKAIHKQREGCSW